MCDRVSVAFYRGFSIPHGSREAQAPANRGVTRGQAAATEIAELAAAQRLPRADGRLFTSKSGGADVPAPAPSAACADGAFAIADEVASGVLPAVAVDGERGERESVVVAVVVFGEEDVAPSVLAKMAIPARTSNGRRTATMIQEKRLRREAARTRSVGSGR